MKVVINIGTGVWELSPKAMKRLAELRGLTPMFVRFHGWTGKEIQPEHIKEEYSWMTYDRNSGEQIEDCVYDRGNVNLIKVVEELGEQANWGYSKLKVVELPQHINYKIVNMKDYGCGVEAIATNGDIIRIEKNTTAV